eukprot:7377776-Prymnesium_polylepis.1
MQVLDVCRRGAQMLQQYAQLLNVQQLGLCADGLTHPLGKMRSLKAFYDRAKCLFDRIRSQSSARVCTPQQFLKLTSRKGSRSAAMARGCHAAQSPSPVCR